MKSIIGGAVLGLAVVTAHAQVPAQSLKNMSINSSNGKLAVTLLSSTIKGFVAKDGNVIASMQVVLHGGRKLIRGVAYVSGCEGTDGAVVLSVDGSDVDSMDWSNKGFQVNDGVAVNICDALAITQANAQYAQTQESMDLIVGMRAAPRNASPRSKVSRSL